MKKKESECSAQIWRRGEREAEMEEKRGSERGRQTPLSESRSAVFKLAQVSN